MPARCAVRTFGTWLLLGIAAVIWPVSRGAAQDSGPTPIAVGSSLQALSHGTLTAHQERDELRAIPAEVISRLALRPAAGNGIGPVCAAVDPQIRRLYVLNQRTHNLSVVDLAQRKVVAVVPVRVGWPHSPILPQR